MALVDNVWYVDFGDGSTTGYYAVTQWAATTTKVCGNLVRQLAAPAVNNECVFVCIASTSGTGQTGGAEPTWTVTRGAKNTDSGVTWQEATGIAALNGDLSTNTPTWTIVKNTAVTLGQVIQNVAGTLVLICTTAGTAGNGAEPSWAAFTNAGATTADNTVTWTTLGASFSSWAAPHARLANAFATNWGQAGNSFFMASEHAETQSSVMTCAAPGTAANPNFIYCVTKTAVPPTSSNLTTGASVSTTGANSLTTSGSFEWSGATINVGSAANQASITLLSAAGGNQRYKNFAFVINNTNASSVLQLGNIGTSAPQYIETVNCTLQFGATGQGIGTAHIDWVWRNTLNAIAGATFPTTLIKNAGTVRAAFLLFDGIDLSALGSGKTIVGQLGVSTQTFLRNCKLGASVTVAATPSGLGSNVVMVEGDSSGTNYRHEKYTYTGTQTVETTIIRTGGASDGTTPISWKVVSTANSKWILPFELLPIAQWVDTTGSHTATIFGTTTGGGVPNNDDIWIEVEYLGDASSPQGSFQTTTKSDNLAASGTTNNSSDASTWGGGGAGNGFKMVTPSFTVNQKGYITVVVKVAKASSTFYIDPLIVVG